MQHKRKKRLSKEEFERSIKTKRQMEIEAEMSRLDEQHARLARQLEELNSQTRELSNKEKGQAVYIIRKILKNRKHRKASGEALSQELAAQRPMDHYPRISEVTGTDRNIAEYLYKRAKGHR